MNIFNPTMKMIPLMAMLLIIFTGCATIESDWKRTRQNDTIQSYQTFLSQHPESKFSDQARKQIEIFAWETAKQEDSIASYNSFLKEHPNSQHIVVAKRRIQEIQVEQAKSRKEKFLESVKNIEIILTQAPPDNGDRKGYELRYGDKTYESKPKSYVRNCSSVVATEV